LRKHHHPLGTIVAQHRSDSRAERPPPLERAEEVRMAKAKPLTTDAMSVIETRRSGVSELFDPLRPVTAFHAVGASESVGIWAPGHPPNDTGEEYE